MFSPIQDGVQGPLKGLSGTNNFENEHVNFPKLEIANSQVSGHNDFGLWSRGFFNFFSDNFSA